MTPRAGKAIAWCSFALGIAVSVAGNILHSAITPAGLGELVGAAFWPLALMLSIEILTRVRWQLGRWWMIARVVGLFLVGIVAAVLSYRHLAGLMTSWGEDALNAHLGPFAVDGLMLLAATALLSISKESRANAEPAKTMGAASQIVTLHSWGPLSAPKSRTPAEWFDEVDASIRSDVKNRISSAVFDETLIEINAEVTEEPDGTIKVAAKNPPAKEPSKLHIVDSVSESVSEEAARQAFIQSLEGPGKPLSATRVAEMMGGIPRSTAHRKFITAWKNEARRIER